MVRVRDLTHRHTIVVRCLPCDRTARIQPRQLGHLQDHDRRVLDLGYRCTVCRRRAMPIAVQLAGADGAPGAFVDVDWNEAMPDVAARQVGGRPDDRRLTTAAEADFAAHGLRRRPFGVGRPRTK